ncbi:MBL fold metallo-hydrolase [Demequina sp. NBRC 110051]|uniref:MBL fold metallo-hydrolase n=1 Tax=Demequina sp. NBRC 110051 TaxID=1570340 RepID=UPI000A00A0E7|nr:MBL fold metallo-hydrolase [Demequina sp. NBRC 110051]
MRLTVIGSSGSVPGPASPSSSYLLEADDDEGRTWRVLLDAGSGALGVLQRFCDPRDLDAVFISHLHPDHCADLAHLDTYLSYHPDGPAEPVTVYGPFGTAGRIAQLKGTDGHSEALPCVVWQASGHTSIGPMRVTVESVRHPVPAYAFRIEGPSEDPATASAVLTYSGDTDECDGLEVAAADADVLLCEASFLTTDDAPEGLHLTGLVAGQVAERARAGRLILTHIPPWTDCPSVHAEAASAYDGPIDLAHPGLRVEL